MARSAEMINNTLWPADFSNTAQCNMKMWATRESITVWPTIHTGPIVEQTILEAWDFWLGGPLHVPRRASHDSKQLDFGKAPLVQTGKRSPMRCWQQSSHETTEADRRCIELTNRRARWHENEIQATVLLKKKLNIKFPLPLKESLINLLIVLCTGHSHSTQSRIVAPHAAENCRWQTSAQLLAVEVWNPEITTYVEVLLPFGNCCLPKQ